MLFLLTITMLPRYADMWRRANSGLSYSIGCEVGYNKLTPKKYKGPANLWHCSTCMKCLITVSKFICSWHSIPQMLWLDYPKISWSTGSLTCGQYLARRYTRREKNLTLDWTGQLLKISVSERLRNAVSCTMLLVHSIDKWCRVRRLRARILLQSTSRLIDGWSSLLQRQRCQLL